MQSHNEGEIWGLALLGDNQIATSADDNRVLTYNLKERVVEKAYTVTTESKKAKRGGASSLSDLPDSQCSRGLAFSQGHLAILCNDG
jgi:hypothetical protein